MQSYWWSQPISRTAVLHARGCTWAAPWKLCLLHCATAAMGVLIMDCSAGQLPLPIQSPSLQHSPAIQSQKRVWSVILPSGSHCIWTMGWTTEAEAKSGFYSLTLCGIMLIAASLYWGPELFHLFLSLHAVLFLYSFQIQDNTHTVNRPRLYHHSLLFFLKLQLLQLWKHLCKHEYQLIFGKLSSITQICMVWSENGPHHIHLKSLTRICYILA